VAFAIAAATKCAQFPFSRWLPFAMAAPTPISALVHSSTLVVAGVLLFIRVFSVAVILMCLIIAAAFCLTLLYSNLQALFESDLKKLVAFSTLSHVGMMFLAAVWALSAVSLLHLVAHAFSKSLLFLLVGVCLHRGFGSQTIRGVGL